jgi:hypothetical protein
MFEKVCSYIYYLELESDEHYPYSSEIAILLHERLGWSTRTNKPPVMFMAAFLREKESKDERIKYPMYYNTKKGLVRVYPFALEYLEELADYLSGEYEAKINVAGRNYCLVRR